MLVIGVAGTELTAAERDWLQHDACAGVILFTRNFASRAQVSDLAAAIREAAPRPQLVCVDQEGGRVQRFREGYSALPSLEGFGRLYGEDPQAAVRGAREHAWLMASEILATGIDPTLALVLSQVVLSFGIPFAVVPLMWLASRKQLMGEYVNSRGITIAGWIVTAGIIALNVGLVVIELASL